MSEEAVYTIAGMVLFDIRPMQILKQSGKRLVFFLWAPKQMHVIFDLLDLPLVCQASRGYTLNMALDINILKSEIVERLKNLNPDKIVIFGSYAYGTPDDDSDVDIFIIKSVPKDQARAITLQARKLLRDIAIKHQIGFDILTAPEKFMQSRQDPFYRDDILAKGKIIYAKQAERSGMA